MIVFNWLIGILRFFQVVVTFSCLGLWFLQPYQKGFLKNFVTQIQIISKFSISGTLMKLCKPNLSVNLLFVALFHIE